MNEDQVIERLPWFLNGTLAEDEAAEVRRFIEESPRVREEHERCKETWKLHAAEPPTEDLVAFVEGKLEGTDREIVERHLQSSEAARQEVALLRQGHALVEASERGEVALFERPKRATSTWRPALIAAALTALVTSLLWWTMLAPTSPSSGVVADARLNVPIVEVMPASGQIRGGDDALPLVSVGDDGRIVLILVSENDPGGAPLELEALDDGGEVFFTARGLERDPRGEYTVSLTLPDDIDLVTLRVLAVEGEVRREVDRYGLRISRRVEPAP